ncbi:hypothetical protein BD410DRAFT_5450 [Rickenella mellea]|uniref:Uncharacterized protein n=1 Tax=Rickenella mellea TaxID=50990 RepID=A0A4R5XDJ6_9AGAM|nr:hypothetical protein BD410DRAFT_5450 [Rickenella mellea]
MSSVARPLLDVCHLNRPTNRRPSPPYPSFTLLLWGDSPMPRKKHPCAPVRQDMASWGMTTADGHPEPAHCDESKGIYNVTVEPRPDDSSEISVLVLGEPACGLNVIEKFRNVMTKLLPSLSHGKKHKQ